MGLLGKALGDITFDCLGCQAQGVVTKLVFKSKPGKPPKIESRAKICPICLCGWTINLDFPRPKKPKKSVSDGA